MKDLQSESEQVSMNVDQQNDVSGNNLDFSSSPITNKNQESESMIQNDFSDKPSYLQDQKSSNPASPFSDQLSTNKNSIFERTARDELDCDDGSKGKVEKQISEASDNEIEDVKRPEYDLDNIYDEEGDVDFEEGYSLLGNTEPTDIGQLLDQRNRDGIEDDADMGT